MYTKNKMFLALYQAKLSENSGIAFSVLRRTALEHDSYKLLVTKELITDTEPEGLYWYTLLTDGDIFLTDDISAENIAGSIISAMDDLNTWKSENVISKGSLQLRFGLATSGENVGKNVFWLTVKKGNIKTTTELLLETAAEGGGEGGAHSETLIVQTANLDTDSNGYVEGSSGSIVSGVSQVGSIGGTSVSVLGIVQQLDSITVFFKANPIENQSLILEDFLSGVTLSYPDIGNPQVYLNTASAVFSNVKGVSWTWSNVSGTFNIPDDIELTAVFDIAY